MVGDIRKNLQASNLSNDIMKIQGSNAYASLEVSNFFVSEGISFRNDGDQIDFRVQLTHELDVNRLQSKKEVLESSLRQKIYYTDE